MSGVGLPLFAIAPESGCLARPPLPAASGVILPALPAMLAARGGRSATRIAGRAREPAELLHDRLPGCPAARSPSPRSARRRTVLPAPARALRAARHRRVPPLSRDARRLRYSIAARCRAGAA
ncbi:hypothetical protein EGY16_31730 [Burkholderia pseudomallei]|uniref:Uncharacterized protein n=3 Tax=Burkholderia pseudomallei TaxID=28450 RepID=A0AAX0U568_BURPE|nr:leucine rich repeat containing 38 [Burkholderia pseudomallei 1106a]AFR18660.1 leucine-rich repeat-containing protein [Burkholderia pseudomallei BPC006]ARL53794.1 hypothetical protein BOC51_29320 [Burkholderia pseudomallei]EES22395.1 conserved hypothetical protein [Burkholderia pseudomallei 1106b]EET05338.1 conserved hypothetical protein [Burkholderia pseudomallei 1710a]